MLQARIIPSLLLRHRGLVKGVRFAGHQYVGDPINAVRIFNDKEVDEICFLDIGCTAEGSDPDFALIKDIATECFIPFSYGGGIKTFEQAAKIFTLGVERVIVNSAAAARPRLVEEIATVYGGQSVVVSVDVKQGESGGYTVYTHGGKVGLGRDLISYVKEMESAGAGEILLNSIDREGTGFGFDLPLIKRVSDELTIPLIAAGGPGNLQHLRDALHSGASAVAVGSMFTFYGRHRAVLITYPSVAELKEILSK